VRPFGGRGPHRRVEAIVERDDAGFFWRVGINERECCWEHGFRDSDAGYASTRRAAKRRICRAVRAWNRAVLAALGPA
jgi:hypothetical protein